MHRLSILVFSLFLSSAAFAQEPLPEDGVGPYKFGMTVEEVRGSQQESWTITPAESVGEVLTGGPKVVLGGAPFAVSLIFNESRLHRIVLSASWETPCDLVVNSLLSNLEQTFGSFRSAPSLTETGRLVQVVETPGGSEVRHRERLHANGTSERVINSTRRGRMYVDVTAETPSNATTCNVHVTFGVQQVGDESHQDLTLAELDQARSLLNPVYAELPTVRSFQRHYPRAALGRRVSGEATLDCVIGEDGRLRCRVLREAPPGEGFGEAAVEIARDFRVLQDEAGNSAIGKRVRVPIRFRVG